MIVKVKNKENVTIECSVREARQIAFILSGHALNMKKDSIEVENKVIVNSCFVRIMQTTAQRIDSIAHIILNEVGE